MKRTTLQLIASLTLMAFAIAACTDHMEVPSDPTKLTLSTPIATGLHGPIGLATDDKGNTFVTEIGSGNNDGSVTMVAIDGTKTTLLSGLPSAPGPEGTPEGISHLVFKSGKLYILHGIAGKLFIVDVSGFGTGSPQIPLASVETHDYKQQILDMHLASPDNSNLYDLTFGPDGHLYMVDAGSNAIFKRDKDTGAITLFAKIPQAPNPARDAVPTGIVYDGSRFLVSTLTGGPFTAGTAKIHAVDMMGNVSDYKTGFTTLTHLTLTPNNKPLALKFAFGPGGGAVLDENGTVLLGGLNMPTDIERIGDHEYMLLSLMDGALYRLNQ